MKSSNVSIKIQLKIFSILITHISSAKLNPEMKVSLDKRSAYLKKALNMLDVEDAHNDDEENISDISSNSDNEKKDDSNVSDEKNGGDDSDTLSDEEEVEKRSHAKEFEVSKANKNEANNIENKKVETNEKSENYNRESSDDDYNAKLDEIAWSDDEDDGLVNMENIDEKELTNNQGVPEKKNLKRKFLESDEEKKVNKTENKEELKNKLRALIEEKKGIQYFHSIYKFFQFNIFSAKRIENENKRKENKKREKKKKKKAKKKEKIELQATDQPEENSKKNKQVSKPLKCNIQYSKLQFGDEPVKKRTKFKDVPSGKNYPALVEKVKKQTEKIQRLKEAGDDCGYEDKLRWKKALARCEGVKVKDNEALLKRSMNKRQEKKVFTLIITIVFIFFTKKLTLKLQKFLFIMINITYS